ncbi:ABC transporter ATP-binding protein [Rubrimonas cliftonensis]|uniref:Peptide/nickel transport system ATP-binding protein n=1 Tax=Rubrimonas cliftonensis TaxID=89524 RepID=A0A1H4A2K1_9RHOB|nr:oligopeptide/dipeptide ABC transporter ATP-binding protein [Rubrimonas cliftonensis]SEA30100.1 peptide/nickel transport system ATP-binding protein [Rubrimonas cliftonensis]
MSEAFLSVEAVSKTFAPRLSLGERIAAALGAPPAKRPLQAVREVSLEIRRGETLGLVGESGCGKSTLGRMIAGIAAPSAGAVSLDGDPVMRGGRKATTRVQTVFQDPFASLDPRMKVGDAIAEGPVAHGLVAKPQARAYVAGWLDRCGLDPAMADRWPHQFSGGQRQRVAIARALAMQPDLLVCDEPVASLDVSIQAQILNLLMDLRRDLGLTCLFVSHDISIVRHVSDRVAVMYLGRIVELGPAASVLARPAHPYSLGLLESAPRLSLDGRSTFRPIPGDVPSPLAPPPGCAFAPRCSLAQDACRAAPPPLSEVAPERFSACLRADVLTGRPPGQASHMSGA